MKPLQIILIVLGSVALLLFIVSCVGIMAGFHSGYCQSNPSGC